MQLILLAGLVAMATAHHMNVNLQKQPYMTPYQSYKYNPYVHNYNNAYNTRGFSYNTPMYHEYRQPLNSYGSNFANNRLAASPYAGAREVHDVQLTSSIQDVLAAAGIEIPAGHIIVITAKETQNKPQSVNQLAGKNPVNTINQGSSGMSHLFQQIASGQTQGKPLTPLKPTGPVAGRPLGSVPSAVPVDVQQAVPVSQIFANNHPQNFFPSGSVVTQLEGKNNGELPICSDTPVPEVIPCRPCGSVQGKAQCITVQSLVTGNPFLNNANNAFKEGIKQLGDQLQGRQPVGAEKDDDAAYYWRYTIYYHVNDFDARLWMGHVQLYLEAYEWTLGLYYYIDPNGDLRLMYYSATPEDGYVAEEAIWPGFIPYEWYDFEDGKSHFNTKRIVNKSFLKRQPVNIYNRKP